MRNGELRKLVSVTGRILLAFLFAFSQSAWAGQDPQAKDNPTPAKKAAVQQASEKSSPAATTAKTETEDQAETSEKSSAEEKPSGGGKHEGIKVHGHWAIDVRNPDGTLVTHREFENSIQASGSASLVSLLAGNQLPGPWQVDLIGSPQPCEWPVTGAAPGFSVGPEPCVIVPSNTVVNGVALPSGKTQVDAISFTLTVTASSGQLVLNGSVTAATTTSISSVATVLSPCINGGPITANGVSPTTLPCPTLLFPIPAPFTSATLTQGVPVSAGQTIAVTVTISFS